MSGHHRGGEEEQPAREERLPGPEVAAHHVVLALEPAAVLGVLLEEHEPDVCGDRSR